MSEPPLTAGDIAWGATHESHVFQRLGEGHYRLEIPEASAVFDVDRLWRGRQRELCGEIVITCALTGISTFDGNLFSGQINLSDGYRRRDVCDRLRKYAKTGHQVDWESLINELSARIIKAEREGCTAQLLHTYDRPTPDDTFNLEGIVLPKRHPSILFGDGGTFKSFLSLYIAGWLGQQGIRVLFADWELEGADHRDRLERLFGPDMPHVYYQRLHRPMVHEIDGIKREIDEKRIEYIVCDSVGYATDGPPESADAAMGYFRAVRQLGIGSTHIAHVTKPRDDAPDPTKPFGSVFWHNSARMTWFAKRTESTNEQRFVVALFNRKSNLGGKQSAVGLEIDFGGDRTGIKRVDLRDVDEFASSLPMWQRMKRALESGPKTLVSMADEFGAVDDQSRDRMVESMGRTVRRKKEVFTKLTNAPDGIQRIALVPNHQVAH